MAEGYVVHEFLGRGSAGMVWRATQEGTLREVALKFPAGWALHGRGGQRFAREAEIAAALDHVNVAGVFGTGEGTAGPWLAMELVMGPPLDVWVAEQDATLKERVGLFQQICAGVRHAHQRGVIHRDLKPGNVLVAPDGTPKVVDFGLACWQQGPSLEVTLTRQGEIFGSLAWMPPEQAAGRWLEVDALSDVYALGAILFSLLTDRPPLDASLPPAALLLAAQGGERPPLRSIRAGVAKDLAAVVDQCLSLEKSRRYQSAAELEEEVVRWLAGEPVRARLQTPGYWVGKKLRRHWAGFAAVVVLGVGALVVGWSYFAGKRKLAAEQQAALEREADRSARTLQEAQQLVTQLLVEMKPKLEQGGGKAWAEEAEKRVAAFPWSLGGGTGTYDPRPFRARAAMAVAEELMRKLKWGDALLRWNEAANYLNLLVGESPDDPVHREALGRLRLGQLATLLRLGFHKEAVTAAEQALAVFTSPSGRILPAAVRKDVVELMEELADAVLTAKGRMAEVLPLLTKLGQRLSPGPDPTAEEAGWDAQINGQRAVLTARLGSPAEANSIILQAVASARRCYDLADGSESAARILVEALVREGELAMAQEDRERVTARLTEAMVLLNQKKSRSPEASQSMEPFRKLAVSWERFGLWREKCGAWDEATGSFDQAIDLFSKVHRAKKDLAALQRAARLLLRNANLAKLQNQSGQAVRNATAAAIRFETIADGGKKLNMDLCFDWADAALLLVELKAPPGEDGRPWVEIVRKALSFPLRNQGKLTPQERGKLSGLEGQLAGYP